MKVFPNPIVETFTIEFTLPEKRKFIINILDISGKIVKELYSGNSLKGINYFSFNKASLPAGTYFLVLKANSDLIKNEKIIIAD
ncbi:MAG TPA: T9SS type A sorting domain-containing protein [Bacteroidales bacterium]|nr:T9SS type A sorting domain-containing protein [Bacteroidales bacterium]